MNSSICSLFELMKIEEIVNIHSKHGDLLYEVKWVNTLVCKQLLEKLFPNIAPMIDKINEKQRKNDSQNNFSTQLRMNEDINARKLQENIVEDTSDGEEEEECIEGTMFMCDICNVAFPTYRLLSNHKHQCPPGENANTHTTSEKTFSSVDHSRESGTIHDDTVTCVTEIDRSKEPQNPPSVSLTCRYCSLIFLNAKEYNTHLTKHNKNNVSRTVDDASRTVDDASRTVDDTSGTVGDASSTVDVASRTVDVASRTVDDASRTVDLNFKNMNSSGSGLSIKREKSETVLTNNPNDTIYECQNCKMTFADAEYLSRHLVRCRNQELSNFRCQVCQRGFTTKGSLELHVDAVHLKKKEFGCSLCGRLFSRKHILKVHLAMHYGKRDFACSTCGKTFLQKSNLNRHERIHQSKNFGYKCRHCGQAFTQNKHLQRHLESLHMVKKEEV
ncbi:zinc finger protein 510-like isoform X2 [Hydractinia symbiolongicarpus]|uniref:zinc finger protein 510-like isoform X2 n=1 Tax=Hydractinia symbiolongicarpus TaxID=13093 RepID=UPI00254F9570|nr:zinc finger protein 510-like isoform X2 [Hydractinia symbiolongicarpus]